LTAVIAADEAVEISRDIRHPPDPTAASSRAIGQLISAALDRGARRIIVGCGDSGAYDGGIGMAGALGIRFLDGNRAEIVEAGGLLRLAAIDMSNRDPRLSRVAIQAIVDPGQALLGMDGVVAAHGPRHGVSATQVLRMEQGLARFAKIVHACLGIDVASLPGAGAAGGLAAGLAAFGGATVISHADFLEQLDALRAGLAAADMVISAGPATESDTSVASLATDGSGTACSCTWLERKAAILGLPVIALSPERLVAAHRLDDERATTAASAGHQAAAQIHPLQEGGLRLPAASAASLRRALGGWHRPAESV
jgi:glycerate kinase